MMRFVHRKTLFGKQFHRVYPDPHNRPDWAQETRCSRCIENHQEDDDDPPEDTPQHHVLTCPYIGNLRHEIISKFNLDWQESPPPPPPGAFFTMLLQFTVMDTFHRARIFMGTAENRRVVEPPYLVLQVYMATQVLTQELYFQS